MKTIKENRKKEAQHKSKARKERMVVIKGKKQKEKLGNKERKKNVKI